MAKRMRNRNKDENKVDERTNIERLRDKVKSMEEETSWVYFNVERMRDIVSSLDESVSTKDIPNILRQTQNSVMGMICAYFDKKEAMSLLSLVDAEVEVTV